MKAANLFLYICLIFFASSCTKQVASDEFDIDSFKNPPKDVCVHTWWHWIDGRITREGITKDLESMKARGIVQATILNIGMSGKDIDVEKVLFDSEEWYEMFQWALKEANRLGITIGIHNCDGWSESGGPWITPEMSMKKFVFTKTRVETDQKNIVLPKPLCETDFYRDVTVVAFKNNQEEAVQNRSLPKVIVNDTIDGMLLLDGNPESMIEVRKADVVRITFPAKELKTRIAIMQNFKGAFYFPGPKTIDYTVKASDDGIHYRNITTVSTNKFYVTDIIEIPATQARFFKVEVSEIHDLRPWHHAALAEIQLLGENENPAYFPTVLYPMEKTASARILEPEKLYTVNNNIDPNEIISEKNVLDLSDKMQADGTLNWSPPSGNWSVIRFGYTTTGATNGPATAEGSGLECDKMDTTAVNLHFSKFPQKLIDKAGDFTGNTFKFLLIDSWERGFQTWTKAMPGEFEKRRGYNLTKWIPVLCGETVENTELSEAFLYDFRKTIADLFEQYYYGHFNDLCHRNKLELHGEVIYGDTGPFPPVDVLLTNKYMDMPMYEFWAEKNNDNMVEYIPTKDRMKNFPVFASNFYDKPVIGAEAYTGHAHYSESPADLKLFGDRAFCSGINQMILHSYVHQPNEQKPGLTLGQHGSHFNRHNPYWSYSDGWFEYQSRIQYFMQKGKISTDILYFLGDQLPQFFENSFIDSLPDNFQTVPCNLDVLQQLKVKKGKLQYSKEQNFSLLVLPDQKYLSFEALKQIERLVREGAAIYGKKQENMLSLNDIEENKEEFENLTDRIWSGYSDGQSGENKYEKGVVIWGKPAKQVLADLNLKPDFTSNLPDSENLMFIHKNTETSDVYFVVNQQNTTLERQCFFKTDKKVPEIWNPMTGDVKRVGAYEIQEGGITIPVTFKPEESHLFVFRGDKETEHSNKETSEPKPVSVTEIKDFNGKLVLSPVNSAYSDTINIDEFKSFTDFTEPEVKYFAGKADYKIDFKLPASYFGKDGAVYLRFGKLDAAAEILLNGKSLGTVWFPGNEFQVDGLLKEDNHLEIKLGTTCRNRIIGDFKEYGEVRNLWTSGPVQNFLKKDSPLKPSGIIDPVQLVKYPVQNGND